MECFLILFVIEYILIQQVNNLTVLEKSCGHCKVWVICVYPMYAHETL